MKDLERDIKGMAEMMIAKGSAKTALEVAREIEADADCTGDVLKAVFFAMVADEIQTRLLN